MDIVLGHIRQLEINHVRHAVDIDAASGDIGGDKHAGLPIAKAGERALALRLRLVAVDGRGFDTGIRQVPDDAVGAVLRAGEHEDPRESRIAQYRRQQIAFLLTLDKDDALLDALYRRRRRRDNDLDRIRQILLSQGSDGLGHGRGEQEGLPLTRQQLHNALQRVDETEVEHAVGLVENQNLNVRQGEPPVVDQIEQASRGGDKDIDAAGQLLALTPDGDASEHYRCRERHCCAVRPEAVGNLAG